MFIIIIPFVVVFLVMISYYEHKNDVMSEPIFINGLV